MNGLDHFAVIGGDLRQISVANRLAELGYQVKAYGFPETACFQEKVHCSPNLEKTLQGTEVVILPLPCSADDETLNLIGVEEPILLTDLFRRMPDDCVAFGGRVTDKVFELAATHHRTLVDYFAREELEILNAIPTAEGAVQIAMEETCKTINGSKCLVLGNGRIGKVLSRTLACLGAEVTVAARKKQDLAWIKAWGYQSVAMRNLDLCLPQADIIFNTVPSMILGEKQLKKVTDGLIIDLASKPGGADGLFG